MSGDAGLTFEATINGGSLPFMPRASSSTGGDDIYDALNPRGRRRSSTQTSVRPEDALLNGSRRDRLDSNALDVWRNMSLLAWMIRRTLDYCCLWDFQPQTSDEGLNTAMRALMVRDCEASRIDYVGRMDWDDMRRVAEALKILTGDMFFVPLAEGTLQGIEGSFCRNPSAVDGPWMNGARLNKRGRVVGWNFRELKYLSWNNYEFKDREIPARNVWQHVQYEGRLNQIRGLSPITAILNECRDIYETFDHARAKVKLDQLFGIAIFENPDEEADIAKRVTSDGSEATEDADEEENETHYDFGSGPVIMRRTVGEKVEMLQANHPATSTQDFLKLCIQVALKALDLPYNFFDEPLISETGKGHSRQRMPSEISNVGRLSFSVPGRTLNDNSTRWTIRRISVLSRIGEALRWSLTNSSKAFSVSSTCCAIEPDGSTILRSSISRFNLVSRSFIVLSVANKSVRRSSGAVNARSLPVSYSRSRRASSTRLLSMSFGSIADRSVSFRSTAARRT